MANDTEPNSPNVRVVLTGHGQGEVFIDGVKVNKVRGLSFGSKVGEANTLTIELVPHSVEIEGPAGVAFSEIERLRAELSDLVHDHERCMTSRNDYANENEKLRNALQAINQDIKSCDWSCERCGNDYGMPDTDIALYVREALKDGE